MGLKALALHMDNPSSVLDTGNQPLRAIKSWGPGMVQNKSQKTWKSFLKMLTLTNPGFPNHGSCKGNIITLNRSHLHFKVALNLMLLGNFIKFN